MKLTLPFAAAAALLLLSCRKDSIETPAPETPVTKTVAFHVYASKDYSGAFYDNALAEIRLSIGKMNLKNNVTEVVWDTTYSFRQFNQYPQVAQMIQLEKAVPHFENAEVLQTSVVVRYNVNGILSMEAKGDPVQRYEKYKRVTVAF